MSEYGIATVATGDRMIKVHEASDGFFQVVYMHKDGSTGTGYISADSLLEIALDPDDRRNLNEVLEMIQNVNTDEEVDEMKSILHRCLAKDGIK